MTLIGTPVARPDARAKVTGAARYPADLIQPGMLHCKAVFGHRRHARIERLEFAKARALPGVVAVLTAADVPEWDSFNHITLIVAVESRFKIKFQTAELEALHTVGHLADLIATKLAAQGR